MTQPGQTSHASRNSTFLAAVKIFDLGVVLACYLATTSLLGTNGESLSLERFLDREITVGHALFIASYLTIWHWVLRAFRLYGSYRLAPRLRELRDLAFAVLVSVFLLAPLTTILAAPEVPPSFLTLYGAMAFAGLAVSRTGLRLIARQLRSHGINQRRVLVVGREDMARALAQSLREHRHLGYRILELFTVPPDAPTTEYDRLSSRVEAFLDAQGVDEVFVAVPMDSSTEFVRKLIELCDEQGVWIRIQAGVFNLMWGRAVVDDVAGTPLLTVYSGPRQPGALAIKRAIDLACSVMGLVVFSPVLALVALAIKLDSAGPVLFRQERVGHNRRRFVTYKFRTMVDGADRMQASLEHMNEANGPVFKIRDDPRMTPVGKWLRRTSLDELPQLFNVIRGEMSLVGPRPLPVRDVDRIDTRWHRRRFSVKPGITCLWQANSREPDFDEWIRADMEYIDHWSLSLDLKIIAKTLPAVVMRRGAH